MNNDHPKLAAGLARLGLDVSPDTVENLVAYMALLKEWSGTYNLVASGEREFLLARHVLDSLSLARWLQPGPLLDIGTGAGLPGLPLAIVDTARMVTMLDSAGKKIRFIRHVKRTLKLDNARPLHQRAEDGVDGELFANVTSRAFTSLGEFAAVARPYMDGGSKLLAMKGAYPGKELEELPAWVNVQSVESFNVPYLHAERHLVIMSISEPVNH